MTLLSLNSCAAVCQHRDIDDDSLCDKCYEAYTDGKDTPAAIICQHRDVDDDSLCDKCYEAYTDGKDTPAATICQHRDVDDDSLCDKCSNDYADGIDSHIHDFIIKSTDKIYQKNPADSENAAIYYYSCTCGIISDKTFSHGNPLCYKREGDYIYFGEYPQTIKASDVNILSTQDDRGYYLGSDGFYYSKIMAKPYGNDYYFSDDSDVTSGQEYYFKVEPIRWRILKSNGETALILCDSIIDNTAYNFSNACESYEESSIRAWLNSTFYKTAFNELQSSIILATNISNTDPEINTSESDCLNDKVFLLSYTEVTNANYGFKSEDSAYDDNRKMQASDYSRANGCFINANFNNCGTWWLRSYNTNYTNVKTVGLDSWVIYTSLSLDNTSYGVVPAIQIVLY